VTHWTHIIILYYSQVITDPFVAITSITVPDDWGYSTLGRTQYITHLHTVLIIVGPLIPLHLHYLPHIELLYIVPDPTHTLQF